MNAGLLLAALSLAAVAKATPPLTLLSSVGEAPPTKESKRVRLGEPVTLHLAEKNVTDLRWYKVEPAALALDNTRPRFHYEAVPYREVELLACRGARTCRAEITATNPALHGGLSGVGTMAFQVRGRLADGTPTASPGVETTLRGGLAPDVHRITVRRDDTYLGMLTELFQTPYIFGSDGPPGGHQADLLIGSDCADLAVYGLRRLGAKVPYVSTWTIAEHLPEVAHATATRDGVALTSRGDPVRIGRARGAIDAGDLLLFPSTRHVGVLYEDRPPHGILDDGDLLLHTCWAPPRIEPLKDTGCASFPLRVLSTRRWRGDAS